MDGLRCGSEPAEQEGPALGLGFHIGAQHGGPQSHGGIHSALPESHPGSQEERHGQRAPALGRHQCPLRR